MTSQANISQGSFITFEGGDGAGKSTHINFLAHALTSCGREVVCLREPGGTSVGEALRAVVLDPANTELCDRTELLVYEAARAQIVCECIEPALARGAVVLCDRFFDSTTAYQAYGRGLSLDFVQRANEFACRGLRPNRTVLMVCKAPVEVGLERATHHGTADRLEQAGIDFHERVNSGFFEIAASEPDRFRIVESMGPKSRTAQLVFAAVADVVGWDADDLPFDESFFEHANVKHGTGKVVTDQNPSSDV